jgi:peptidoglycan/LPS O-acetylase OafA/YrhL
MLTMPPRVEVTPLPSSKAFIPGLDGIRALCVIVIFLYHSQILRFIPGPLATTTFFFLSGYLITTLFVKEFRKTGRIDLAGFYYRRALRTMPPLFVAMLFALACALFLGLGGPMIGWKVGGNFFSYTNYALAFSGSSEGFLPGSVHLWSLAVDEHFYLLFAPIFAFLAVRYPMRFIVGGLVLA